MEALLFHERIHNVKLLHTCTKILHYIYGDGRWCYKFSPLSDTMDELFRRLLKEYTIVLYTKKGNIIIGPTVENDSIKVNYKFLKKSNHIYLLFLKIEIITYKLFKHGTYPQ